MKLNGWQRLWIVLSAIWVVFALYRIVVRINELGMEIDWMVVLVVLIWVFAPPLAVYVAGLAVGWVRRGFKAS